MAITVAGTLSIGISGRTINVSVNGGTSVASATTGAGGTFTTGAFTAAANAVICVYETASNLGACICISNNANITGMTLPITTLAFQKPTGTTVSPTAANVHTAGTASAVSGYFTSGSNTTFNFKVSITFLTTVDFTSSTVTFSNSGAAGITTGASNIGNLTASGTAALTLSNTMTIKTGSTLTISSGSTLVTTNGTSYTFTGVTVSNSGTIQLVGSETLTGFSNDATHGTVTYTGTGSTTYTSLTAGSTYNNLTFNGSGRTWQPAADTTINGNLTITAGTLDMSNANKNLSVAGNWSNSGTFTAGTGTVTFNGTAQTISGSTSFYDGVLSTPDDVITVTDGTTQTFTNSFTSNGTSGHPVTFQGSSTGGYTFAMPSTQSISFISISRCTATGNTGVAGSTSTNGGNNVNWSFGGGGGNRRRRTLICGSI